MDKGYEYVSEYLFSEREEINSILKVSENKRNSLVLEIKEIQKKLGQMMDNIDFAYEAFAPNSKKNNFLHDEIELLKLKEKELFFEESEVSLEVEKYSFKLNKLNTAIKCFEKDDIVKESKDKINVIYYNRFLKEQEIERKRIANDLHDTVIQVLAGLIHKIEFCTKVLDVDPIRVKLEMQIVNNIIRDSINGIRDIIYDLRPMTFDDLGFEETLRRAIDKIYKTSGISSHFAISGDSYEIDQMTSISLYRIMTEACINSVKHSNAKNVVIRLSYFNEYVSISIKDDGDGFDLEEYKNNNCSNSIECNRKCFGLTIMRDRALVLSGEININSEKDNGTEVFVKLPTKDR